MAGFTFLIEDIVSSFSFLGLVYRDSSRLLTRRPDDREWTEIPGSALDGLIQAIGVPRINQNSLMLFYRRFEDFL